MYRGRKDAHEIGQSTAIMLHLILLSLAAECGQTEAWKSTEEAGSSIHDHHQKPNHDHWDDYKTRHGKTYGSHHEEHQRKVIRNNRLDMIRAHNIKASAGKSSYFLEDNHLIDLTSDEYRKLLGYRYKERHRWLEDPRHDRRSTVLSTPPRVPTYYYSTSVESLPACVNWTAEGWVGSVKTQGKCGSCWSHSAVGAIEAQHYNHTRIFVDLSEQNLLDCSSQQGNKGCYGGNMQNAFWYVQNQGIEALETYPYTSGSTGHINAECKFDTRRSITRISGMYNVDQYNEVALQQAVAAVGPISAALDANSIEFQTYSGGVYRSSTCGNSLRDVNHAVLVVGYGIHKGEHPYWLIQNTWGTEWGINGYMMLARNADNMCGIATDATFPVIDAPTMEFQLPRHQCPPVDAALLMSPSSSSGISPILIPVVLSSFIVLVQCVF